VHPVGGTHGIESGGMDADDDIVGIEQRWLWQIAQLDDRRAAKPAQWRAPHTISDLSKWAGQGRAVLGVVPRAHGKEGLEMGTIADWAPETIKWVLIDVNHLNLRWLDTLQ
jgi:hypothetical protein